MKTKQILSEKDFFQALQCEKNTLIQNHPYLYFDFGVYGAKLINAKTNKQKNCELFQVI